MEVFFFLIVRFFLLLPLPFDSCLEGLQPACQIHHFDTLCVQNMFTGDTMDNIASIMAKISRRLRYIRLSR